MPHEKRFQYTKEGYIIKIEDRLGVVLPLAWWRLRIGKAAALWNELKNNNKKKFQELAKKYKLVIPEKKENEQN